MYSEVAMAISAQRYATTTKLWAWQQEAVEAWLSAGCRGIVEAVTGAGKTRLALAIIARVLGIRGRALILVPTAELMRQWARELAHAFPRARVRSWGSGRRPSDDADVIVAIVNSVALSAHKSDWVEKWVGFRPSLLVADECHRYAASSFSVALGNWADLRLGLTATLDRPDGGHEHYLLPYFQSVVYELEYARALADEIVVQWDVVQIGVDLTSSEAAKYRRHEVDKREAAAKLEALWQVSQADDGFFARVARAASARPRTLAWESAMSYMSAFSAQRKITGNTEAKFDAFGKLLDHVDIEARVLVFTSTKEAAMQASLKAEAARRSARVVHSDVPSAERREALDDFRDGDVHTLLAPRVLDEGIDVPDCAAAIILGMGSSPRQLKQRLGRIIRRAPGKTGAVLFHIFVRDTHEDVARPFSAQQWGPVQEVARSVRRLDIEELRSLRLVGAVPSFNSSAAGGSSQGLKHTPIHSVDASSSQ